MDSINILTNNYTHPADTQSFDNEAAKDKVTRECQIHKGQQIGIVNISQDCEESQRLQCNECQYDMLQDKKGLSNMNFIPISRIQAFSTQESQFSEFHNWPIISEDARNKLKNFHSMLKKAEDKVNALAEEIDGMMNKLNTALGMFKKTLIKNYFAALEKGKNDLPVVFDTNTLEKMQNILIQSDVQEACKEINEIIEKKYQEKSQFSSQVSAQYLSIENKIKDFEKYLSSINKKVEDIVLFTSNASNEEVDILQDKLFHIKMKKSKGRESDRLIIQNLEDSSQTIEKNQDFYGWAYSDIILDSDITYKMEFSFKQQLNSYVMIGLIPNEHKDTEPPGSGTSHFCKIFGDQNNFYCGQVKSGELIERSLCPNEVVVMKVCINENLLEFSDSKGNINSLHHLYNLESFTEYRFVIQFGQKGSNSVKINSFIQM